MSLEAKSFSQQTMSKTDLPSSTSKSAEAKQTPQNNVVNTSKFVDEVPSGKVRNSTVGGSQRKRPTDWSKVFSYCSAVVITAYTSYATYKMM